MRDPNYWQRRLSRRQALGGAAVAGLGVGALGLVGCGSSNKNNSSSNNSNKTGAAASGVPSGRATAAPTAAAAPKKGGKLVWGSNADMNPQSLPYSSSVWLFPIQYCVYDYLTKYKGFTLDTEARIAKSWEQQSPLDMTLHLREGVKWHTGEPVTADDIVFNVKQIGGPDSRSGVKNLATRVTATATDPQTVALKFSEPLPGVFDLFDYMELAHPATFGDQLTTAKKVIGCGAFTFKEWIPGNHVVVERNPDFWNAAAGQPYLDSIEWKIFPQASMAPTMESGAIDYTAELEIEDAVRLSKEPNFQMVKGSPGFTFLYMAFNHHHPALKDKRIRQALNLAIDRQRISQDVALGTTPPMTLVWPPYSPAYDKTAAASITFDLKKAKQMLDAAGYSPSMGQIPLSFSSSLTATEGIMSIYQSDLQSIGVDAKIDKQESSVYINNYLKNVQGQDGLPGAMSFLLGYAGMFPSTFMLVLQPPTAFRWGDDDPAVKTFLTDTFQKVNVKDTEAAALTAFDQYMFDQAFLNPVIANLQLHVLSKHVQGFNVNVVDDIQFEKVWMS